MIIEPVENPGALSAVAARLDGGPGRVLLESAPSGAGHGRWSFLAARPFVWLRAWGASCELRQGSRVQWLYGDPWMLLERLLARYDLGTLAGPDGMPLGGCFGYWGYDLKHFVEPRLPRRAAADLGLPDLCVGFYDSLVAFDHLESRSWIVSTGLLPDGTQDSGQARRRADWWRTRVAGAGAKPSADDSDALPAWHEPVSNLGRAAYVDLVTRALDYIAAGDIYQANLAQRLTWPGGVDPWRLHARLAKFSPAPFAGVIDAGEFALVSASPEQFLRLSGNRIRTRPIKGTRPRSADPVVDEALAVELRASPKERSELVMITDLLRNDLGRVCEFGSVRVPDLMRHERFPQVHHLVSTVEGRLRDDVTHLSALASCFPGGSITGAPKVRAMEIIEELEPVTRGPYTGCLGYLGFNRESQLAIAIRTAVCLRDRTCLHVGAGIVAESDPEAEYDETLAKAAGFKLALDPRAGG
ncbi:MAG: anthranilate synthase component I family protein, partial [Verrucomicrobiae bacterium]|nr:anthranilate synthase component I family protein [Verrucomicrobiae bacterium]